MGTGSDADASGCGGVAAGNKANGVGGVRGIDAGNAVSGGVVVGKASFVPKTNSSIMARVVCVSWYSCQRSHDFLKQSAVLFPIFGGLTA